MYYYYYYCVIIMIIIDYYYISFYFLEDDLTSNWLIRPYLVHQQLDDHNNPLKPLVDLEHLGLVNNIVEKHLPEEQDEGQEREREREAQCVCV